MSATVYILGAKRHLDGKLHEFGREFRAVKVETVRRGTVTEYEHRRIVIVRDYLTLAEEERHVGPWERMERET